MSFVIIAGTPGTGKTLYAIQQYIIPSLIRGEVVYTNIDGIIASRIAALFNADYFTVDSNLRKINEPQYFYKGVEKNATIVVDESQNLFNNRDWQSEVNKECVAYLTEHRHHGHRVVFIAPTVESVDAGIRRVCELTYRHKSMSLLGDKKTVRCAVYDQCNFTKGPLQTYQWKHDRRIYDCYKSYFVDGVEEKKPRINPLKNAGLIILTIVTIISAFYAIKGIAKIKGRMDNVKKTGKVMNFRQEDIRRDKGALVEKRGKKIVIKINGEEQ